MKETSIGDQLDHYRIDELIASRNQASIYRATDLNTGAPVAIKIPHVEMETDPLYFERFRREEEIGLKLNHPGVMRVFPSEHHGRVYMVMEWVNGRSLRSILSDQGKLPQERATHIAIGICDAVAYIHSHGVIHRDLRPSHFMVDEHDHIKLISFGLASQVGAIKNNEGETNKILTVTRLVKITMAVLAILLIVASVLLIANTIRLSLFSRRREVEVMKLVGATDWFIRWPFVLEGLFLGAFGGAGAWVCWRWPS